jgi:hypothetical protein
MDCGSTPTPTTAVGDEALTLAVAEVAAKGSHTYWVLQQGEVAVVPQVVVAVRAAEEEALRRYMDCGSTATTAVVDEAYGGHWKLALVVAEVAVQGSHMYWVLQY